MRRAAVLALAALVALPFVAAPVTLARLTDADTASASFATASLAAPTSLAGSGGTSASLSWTPSTSSGAAGYNVMRSSTSGSGFAQVSTVTPVSAAATTDSPGNGTWYYVLRTYLQGWTSGTSNEAPVVIGSSTATGYKDCVTTAAVTSASGNNNGYEGGPVNACAPDGTVATDTNSGTSSSTSCTNSGKDRHRFWGYVLGLPASVTSVDGIAVRLDASVDRVTGTNMICVQLSWDSGTNWTTAQTVNLTTTTVATYTLGGATSLWGHTGWTPAQLGASTFRIRITDVSSSSTNSRDFSLDYVGVQVNYTR
jgi:hypothetical protein